MIFVDTGALVARYVARGQHHEAAVATWRALASSGPRLFTSSHVLDETLTLLGRRTSYAYAAERGRELFGSEARTVLRADAADELAALDWMEELADQRVSFTVCVSFALMRRHRIARAFAYDRHFSAAGFSVEL